MPNLPSSTISTTIPLLLLLLLLSFPPPLPKAQQQQQQQQQQPTTISYLDLLIRDYTFNSISNFTTKTGETHDVNNLPSNLSSAGLTARAARFRCGSLTRYGARFHPFRLPIGVNLYPCVERVILITHNLGLNWSISISSVNYNLSGYQLASPILGLTAYNAGKKSSINPNSSYPFEVGILSTRSNPITVNFTGTVRQKQSINPECASFGRDGKTVSLQPMISRYVCGSTSDGHYGLVVKLPPAPPPPTTPAASGAGEGGRVAAWKVAVASSVGSGLGIALLVLLLVAMFAKVKKKARMVEMERRAYEEEALQVSMVGHVRAPVAGGTRTTPTIERHFVHYNPK